MHHVTAMLEKCDYMRCLMIDFSRAFGTVDHAFIVIKAHHDLIYLTMLLIGLFRSCLKELSVLKRMAVYQTRLVLKPRH